MTVRYRQREFPDEYLRPYNTSRRVIYNYYGDGCEVSIVSGMPDGMEKGDYVNHVLTDTCDTLACRDRSLLGHVVKN